MLIEIIGQAKVGLSHLAAWFNVFAGSYHAETLVEINGREYHALALDTHHLAWFEIGYKEDALADKGYDEKFGARPLRRTIQSLIEDSAAEMLLDGRLGRGDRVSAELSGEKIILTKGEN